jgi:carboxyl-terminal processing protease
MSAKKNSGRATIFILLALIVGFVAGNFVAGKTFIYRFFHNTGNKIDVVLDIVDNEYVDEVNVKDLTEKAIPKLIGELDPHSVYIPANELGPINENMEGHFAGLGIEYFAYSDTMVIINIVKRGPAEQAGLLPGDRIVSINDTVFAGASFAEEKMLGNLRGEIGSTIKLGIKRIDSDSILNFTVIRDYIPITTIKTAYEVAEGIGLIKIYDKFSRNTYDEFVNAMAKLLNKGCKSFIIDLRMNGGGQMEAAINICNEFLPAGSAIVYTEGKAMSRKYVTANGLGTLQEHQIIILTDQMSASASEIVAGAIQDNDRGLILGRRTFGKGLVQNQIELSDGSALRLTIARYYTPSGRNIQRKYELGKTDEYNKEWIDRLSNGEEFHQDSVSMDTNLLFHTENGRKVYGGGGIMPDIFVPLDTANLTSYYINLESKDIFHRFACIYSDMNRNKLNKFKNYREMWEYLKTQPILNDIVYFGEANGIKRRTSLINISANHILNATYAYILQNFFGEEVFFIVYMDKDSMIQKAVEILQKGEAYPEVIVSKQNE